MTQRGMFLFILIFFPSLSFLSKVLFADILSHLFKGPSFRIEMLHADEEVHIVTHLGPPTLESLGYVQEVLHPTLAIGSSYARFIGLILLSLLALGWVYVTRDVSRPTFRGFLLLLFLSAGLSGLAALMIITLLCSNRVVL
ncbi:hypothetical protein GMRT_23449 [Giardia muris]|uniref:Uncharacterized protein n=1 Tax=Giardia muris TaxID=5742 RepID=A0A4Z1SPT9_GIAMU|nr:hypothetical protein GMRT_23449 [Giardia muris]|eukprot:TNJ27842.1 hypothetical protein GMRT_23449 [Giardia muris]